MITIGRMTYEGNFKNGMSRPVRYQMTLESQSLLVRILNMLIARNVVGVRLDKATIELKDWLCLPWKVDSSIQLGEVYERKFANENDLASALISHQLASGQRRDEEQLAFSVLKNWSNYDIVLNILLAKLVPAILKVHEAGQVYNWWSKPPYYGPAATLEPRPWSEALKAVDSEEALSRLYKKVAFIHDFGRNVAYQSSAERRNYNNIRSEHSGMRDGRILLEHDPMVLSDRAANQSIWAGTSGSAMDMLNVAKHFEMNSEQLNYLAWAIFAFFHFMPAVNGPSHTFIEVMRGAEKVIGRQKLDHRIDLASANRPAADIAAVFR